MLKEVFSLTDKPVLFKLLVLALMILFSTFISFFIGLLLAVPFFGSNPAQLIQEASITGPGANTTLLKYFQIINQLGVFIIPSLILAWLASHRPAEFLGLVKFPDTMSVLATAILIFTILPTITMLISINEQMLLPKWLSGIEEWMRRSEKQAAHLTETFLKVKSIGGLLFNVFMIGVVASVGEELLFRSVLINLFKKWFGNVHTAVFISSVLFSMFHLQFYGFLPRFVLGAVFGYLFVWSGSVWLPIFAHFVNNTSAVLVYYYYFNGKIETPVERFGAVDNNYLFAFSLAISAVLLWMISTQSKNRKTFHRE
jgi:uncharacterized protein